MAKMVFSDLARWYQGDLGTFLSKMIFEECRALGTFYYPVALQLGLCSQHEWVRELGAGKCFYLSQEPDSCADLLTSFSYLPFEEDSIDLIFLPHTLGFVDNIYSMLFEIDRVLKPCGKLIILGFNPLSFHGLQRLFHWGNTLTSAAAACPTLLSLRFALSHYHYHFVSAKTFFYRPLLRSEKALARFDFFETLGQLSTLVPGSLYLVVAEKNPTLSTRIQPLFHFKNIVIGRRLEPLVFEKID